MMVDERETTNGHSFDLNGSMGPTTEATSNGKGNSGGVSFGEGTSAEGLRIYTRRKRRKMSNSDGKSNSEFNDKIKAGDGGAYDQYVHRLNFDPVPIARGECSLRHCRKMVLQQMYQSHNGHDDGLRECIRDALLAFPESGCPSSIKESLEMSTGLLNQSESSTISESCGRGFFDILISDKFSELCGLLFKNFGVVNVNRILDVNAISTRMKNGAYETSPILYLKDIQQVWTKLQQVGNEMATLAKSLSDKSRAHYEQFVRKPRGTASNCHGCGKKADMGNCLICDSCEEMYHISCSNLVGTEIPPKSWYCTTCLSNGIGSPHDNCIVCDKLKTSASTSTVSAVPTINEPENIPNGMDTDISKICFICKSEVKTDENFRTCGHSLCAHKFYHYRCLTTKQLGVCGPCWYCPSCLCRRCLADKDDDQIVLCDGCDQAYHTYCTSPPLDSIPTGSWFCAKCDRDLKRIRTVKRVYENMQKKVKVEAGGLEEADESGGLDMLVTAAKTLSHQETMDTLRKTT